MPPPSVDVMLEPGLRITVKRAKDVNPIFWHCHGVIDEIKPRENCVWICMDKVIEDLPSSRIWVPLNSFHQYVLVRLPLLTPPQP